ncbi:hypothetical protein [Euzebya sp.]|uniref:hypothetical protein n=1 Tax=Euzebya sp. TaxID=1971409 RepID=UPI003514886F
MSARGMTVETATDSLAQAIGLQVASRLLADADRILIVAEDDVLTGAEAIAAHLGVSRRHVDRYAGVTIPARRIGTKWVASKAALARWMADGVVR